MNSWSSGSTRFRKLTRDEKAEWEDARFQAVLKDGEVAESGSEVVESEGILREDRNSANGE